MRSNGTEKILTKGTKITNEDGPTSPRNFLNSMKVIAMPGLMAALLEIPGPTIWAHSPFKSVFTSFMKMQTCKQ